VGNAKFAFGADLTINTSGKTMATTGIKARSDHPM
jgi:hypothetical protein